MKVVWSSYPKNQISNKHFLELHEHKDYNRYFSLSPSCSPNINTFGKEDPENTYKFENSGNLLQTEQMFVDLIRLLL